MKISRKKLRQIILKEYRLLMEEPISIGDLKVEAIDGNLKLNNHTYDIKAEYPTVFGKANISLELYNINIIEGKKISFKIGRGDNIFENTLPSDSPAYETILSKGTAGENFSIAINANLPVLGEVELTIIFTNMSK